MAESGFAEIKDSAAHSPDKLEEGGVQDFDDVEQVPLEEKWSWNPVDWAKGIYHEITTFNLEMTEKKRILLRAVFGEGLVTFLFLFIAMATAVNNGRQEVPESLVLSAIATAFSAVALIYSFADVSGAHFNPAVTFATMVTGKVSVRKGELNLTIGVAYIGIQLFAAVFATLALLVVFPGIGNSAQSIPDFVVVDLHPESHIVNAFFMELILTFILVYVIFATAFDTVDTKGVKVATADENKKEHSGNNLTIYTTSGNTKAGFAPIAIGFTLGFLCFIGGTVSGGAFNPARAFGPALVSGQGWKNHWIYWVGDLTGAALAGYAQSCFAHEAQQSSSHIKTSKAK
ncbi:hypothetical protein HDV04_002660 [Boothiomyces sp. JEL0838]|nr:hypothetical protein HDV04_002660 [Boothiomyces sp. JEL0838]